MRSPYVNASVIDARAKQPMFIPYLIKDTEVVGRDGKRQTLKIDYTGAVPSQIMGQDKTNLSEKVMVNDITEAVHKYVPKMREKGTDVVVVLAYSGLSANPCKVIAENSAYYLSEIPSVNATMFGHVRAVLPGKDFTGIEGADIAKDTLNGVPVVIPGMWDDHLGVVDLQFSNDGDKWQVTQAKMEAQPIYDIANRKPLAAEDSKLVGTSKTDHDATRQFVSKPTDKSADSMYSYLALVQDDPTVQAVNNARKTCVEHYIQGDPDLTKLSALSTAAPFKVDGHKNNPASYMEVGKDQLTFRNAADLYLYPDTLTVVKTSGKEMKGWLGCSAGQFNQTDPNNTEPQSLINWDGFRAYNFNVIDDVDYQVDVTQPARYDSECQMINANAEKIKSLTLNGKPVDLNAAFLAAINNYRIYGGKFVDTGDSHIAFASSNENRSMLAAWTADEPKRAKEIHPAAGNNRRLAPIAGDKRLDVRFEISPSDKAAAFIKEKEQHPMNKIATSDTGFVIYQVDLSR